MIPAAAQSWNENYFAVLVHYNRPIPSLVERNMPIYKESVQTLCSVSHLNAVRRPKTAIRKRKITLLYRRRKERRLFFISWYKGRKWNFKSFCIHICLFIQRLFTENLHHAFILYQFISSFDLLIKIIVSYAY